LELSLAFSAGVVDISAISCLCKIYIDSKKINDVALKK